MALTNLCIAANGSLYTAETWSNPSYAIDTSSTTYASLITGSTPTLEHDTTIGFSFNAPTNVYAIRFRCRMGRWANPSPGDLYRIIGLNGTTEVFVAEKTWTGLGTVNATTYNIGYLELKRNYLVTRVVIQLLFNTYYNGSTYSPLDVTDIQMYTLPDKEAADTNLCTAARGAITTDAGWSNASQAFDEDTTTEAIYSSGTTPTTATWSRRITFTFTNTTTISRIRLIQSESEENNCSRYAINIFTPVQTYGWQPTVDVSPGTVIEWDLKGEYAVDKIEVYALANMATYDVGGTTYYKDVHLAEIQAFSNTYITENILVNLCTPTNGSPYADEPTWSNLSYIFDNYPSTAATLETGTDPTSDYFTEVGFEFNTPTNVGIVQYGFMLGRIPLGAGDTYIVRGYDDVGAELFSKSSTVSGAGDQSAAYIYDKTIQLGRDYLVSLVTVEFTGDTSFDGVNYYPLTLVDFKLFSLPTKVADNVNLLTLENGVYISNGWEDETVSNAFDGDNQTDAVFSSGAEATTDVYDNGIIFKFSQTTTVSRVRIIQSQLTDNNCSRWCVFCEAIDGSYYGPSPKTTQTTAGYILDINFGGSYAIDSFEVYPYADMATYDVGGVPFYEDVHIAEVQAFSNEYSTPVDPPDPPDPPAPTGVKSYIMEG